MSYTTTLNMSLQYERQDSWVRSHLLQISQPHLKTFFLCVLALHSVSTPIQQKNILTNSLSLSNVQKLCTEILLCVYSFEIIVFNV